MSSLFKGLASVLTPGTSFPTSPTSNPSTDLLRFGQVIDVILDDTSDYYGSDVGIGIIRFRLIPDDISLAEKDISRFAFPVDRANFRVPLPGEQVTIYTIKVGSQLYFGYGQIVQNAYNNVYNSDPFLATRVKYVEQDPLGLSTLQAGLSPDVGKGFAKRFNEKLNIPIEVYEAAAKHPPLNLREGDLTLQGRFGAQVRFTSTLEDISVHKNTSAVKTIGDNQLTGLKGLATSDGDPIVIFQAAKLIPATEKGFTNNDRLDDNSIVDAESSIYLTSTQSIPLEVACSRNLFSWNISITTKAVSKEVDMDSTALSQLIPDKWDPTDTFDINIAGTVGFPAGGAGGYSGGTVLISPAGETSTTPSLWNEAQRYVGWKYLLGSKPTIKDNTLVSSKYLNGALAHDCSGFVNAVLTGPGSKQVFNRSSETTVAAGKNFQQVPTLTAALLNKEGLAIGMDTGPTSFDGGRRYGIDHILLTIANPNTGQIEVWQSSGGKGTNFISVDQAVTQINKKCQRIYLSDFK